MIPILTLDGGGTWALLQAQGLGALYGPNTPGHAILAQFDLVAANSGGSLVLGGLSANRTSRQISRVSGAERPLFQPHLRAVVTRGAVKLLADVKGADGINLYTRRAGERAWRLLVDGCRQFPVYDRRPSNSGRPERREYRAMGVLDAVEIGHPSVIVAAVWPSAPVEAPAATV